VGVTKDCPKFLEVPPVISGAGKATNFKFCTHFHTLITTRPVHNIGKSSRGTPEIF